jgi:hypothetical protein
MRFFVFNLNKNNIPMKIKKNKIKRLHTNSAKHIPNSLSEMTLLPELLALREQSVNHLMQLNNVTIIVSPFIYLMAIKSIQYWFNISFLPSVEMTAHKFCGVGADQKVRFRHCERSEAIRKVFNGLAGDSSRWLQ